MIMYILCYIYECADNDDVYHGGTKGRHGESEPIVAKSSDRPKEEQKHRVLHLVIPK